MTTSSRHAAKQPTNITLDPDLVREARAYTSNLSATVAQLLGDYVASERARRRDADASVHRVIAALDAARASAGLLSDEFTGL